MLTTALMCFVIFVTDGDTLVASCDHHQIVVRLAEIDAPEKRQRFALNSKLSLSEICLNKNAEIVPKSKDDRGRTIAYVTCEGINANTEQIKRGMAWVFDKYVTNNGLYDIQNKAKSSQSGLWGLDSPIPPWEWRKNTPAPKL
ncbi:MAG: thermonuclease family protein [Gammaproteobacteria bacterium]|nr:thermonuclease family protein [Pseudomonadota bacterium]QOJ19985.1 MAG: thermonuclease family protein [Gammaproteobacteria bacterium]